MAPKGFGAAAKAVAKGRGRGGGGRGAGRKASPVNSAGTDSAAAPKRTQQSLGDLLGDRFAKKQKTVADAIGARTVSWKGARRWTTWLLEASSGSTGVSAPEHARRSSHLSPARLRAPPPPRQTRGQPLSQTPSQMAPQLSEPSLGIGWADSSPPARGRG